MRLATLSAPFTRTEGKFRTRTSLVPAGLWPQAHARRWWLILGDEEVRRERLAWVDPVLIEVGHPFAGEEGIIDQEMAGKGACGFLENPTGGLGDDVRGARHADDRIAAQQVLDRGRRDRRARPQRVDRDAFRPQFAGQSQHDEAHAELRNGIGGVRREPSLLDVEGWGERENVRVLRLLQMRDRVFRYHEGAARIDLMHQIEAAHV